MEIEIIMKHPISKAFALLVITGLKAIGGGTLNHQVKSITYYRAIRLMHASSKFSDFMPKEEL